MIDDDFNRQNGGSPCSMIQPLAKNSDVGNGSNSELRCFYRRDSQSLKEDLKRPLITPEQISPGKILRKD